MHPLIFKTPCRTLVLAASITLLVNSAIAADNVSGKDAWEQCKRDLEAQGEHLDRASLIPPPVPDDRNFAMTPLLKPLLDYTTDPTTHQAIFREPDAPVKNISTDVEGSKAVKPKSAGWMTGQRQDLPAWQAYYKAALPEMTHPQSPAEDVLAVLGKFDPMLAELRQAAATRPLSRFPVKYEDGVWMALPHGAVLMHTAQVLALRASAELETSRPDDAFADIQLGFRLADSIRQDPVMISGLVRISMLNALIQPVWEGIASHRWSNDQLAKLGTTFQGMDFLSDMVHTIRSERASSLATYKQFSEDRGLMATFFSTMSKRDMTGFCTAMAMDDFYQNMVLESRYCQEMILSVNPKKQLVDAPRLNRNTSNIEGMLSSPSTVLAKLQQTVFPSVAKKYFQEQIYLDEAAVACAIESYRKAHGALPATLDDLHMADMPHDIINGEPLHYRVTDPDNYLLYSVGWNGADDGGKVVKKETGLPGFEQGDCVWSLKPL